MEFQVLQPRSVHPTTGYSHVVRMGDLLFISGQVAKNQAGEIVGKGDPVAQVEQIYQNLQAILEEAGSGLDRVGWLTVLATSLDYLPVTRQVRNRIFEPFGYFPASTFSVITSLADPDFLVEIDAVAAIK